VKINFSHLFFDIKLPSVFSANKAAIIHNSMEIILGEISESKMPEYANTIARKIRFVKMETTSNRYIWVSDFKRPPQTIL
jgi:hypothetical protein